MPSKINILVAFLLLFIASPFPMAAAVSGHHQPAKMQHCFQSERPAAANRLFHRMFHRKPINTEKKKIDKLAWVVFVGGLLSFLLVFPAKFFLGFAILGFATLITSIFAFHRIKREGTGGKWLVVLGILLVLVPGVLFALVISALSQL